MAKKTTAKTKKVASKASADAWKVHQDFRNAALFVSVLINLIVFIGWLVLQFTSKYDEQVSAILFG